MADTSTNGPFQEGQERKDFIQTGLQGFEAMRTIKPEEFTVRTFNCPNISTLRRIATVAEGKKGVRLDASGSEIRLSGPADELNDIISEQANIQ